MQKTLHYELKKPEITDQLRVTDFNENSDLIDAALANKAEKSALTAVETALASKANAAEVSALSQSVSALSAALGGGGKTARIAWGSYAGTDAFGVDNPSSLTFDFCPALVIIRTDHYSNNAIYARGASAGGVCCDASAKVTLVWKDNAVNWYSNTNGLMQNNGANFTFHYVAIGYPN